MAESHQKITQASEELAAARYRLSLLEQDFAARTEKCRKLGHDLAAARAQLEINELASRKASVAYESDSAELRKRLEQEETRATRLENWRERALSALSQFRGLLIRFAGLKSDLADLKLGFVGIQSYLSQRVELLPQVIQHVVFRPRPLPVQSAQPAAADHGFQDALGTVKDSLDQVFATLRSQAANTEMLKSAFEQTARNIASPEKPQPRPEIAKATFEAGQRQKAKRIIMEKLLGLRSSLQNAKIAVKDFVLHSHEYLLNSVCAMGRAHYANLLREQKSLKGEVVARTEAKWEERVKEREAKIGEMKVRVEELQAENDAIKEKMSAAESEARKIDSLLKAKKEEKVEYQKELSSMLAQMGDVRSVVHGKCQHIKENCDAKVKQVKRVLRAQSIQQSK